MISFHKPLTNFQSRKKTVLVIFTKSMLFKQDHLLSYFHWEVIIYPYTCCKISHYLVQFSVITDN